MSSGDMFRINDPIHGVIEFPKEGLIHRLIETPEFQRLRRIKQLGTVDYVYPGATHTRFAHSIGVAHLIQKACSVVIKDQEVLQELKQIGFFEGYDDSQIELAMTTAAILHDIGHPPYCHTLDGFFFKGKHEDNGEQIILNKKGNIYAEISKSIDMGELPSIVQNEFGYQVIKDIIFIIKHERTQFKEENTLAPLSDLISSQVDCDKLDYIQRDNYYCGTPIRVDIDYIIKNMTIAKVDIIDDYKIVINENAKNAIEHFLISRYLHYDKIIFHKTSLAVEALIERILELMLNRFNNKNKNVLEISNNVEEFLNLDDYSFFSFLNDQRSKTDCEPIIKYLINCFINRDLPKIHDCNCDNKLNEERILQVLNDDYMASGKSYEQNKITFLKNKTAKNIYEYNQDSYNQLKNLSTRIKELTNLEATNKNDLIAETSNHIFIKTKSKEIENLGEISEIGSKINIKNEKMNVYSMYRRKKEKDGI